MHTRGVTHAAFGTKRALLAVFVAVRCDAGFALEIRVVVELELVDYVASNKVCSARYVTDFNALDSFAELEFFFLELFEDCGLLKALGVMLYKRLVSKRLKYR